VWSTSSTRDKQFAPPPGDKTMAAALDPQGAGLPHANVQPFLAVSYIIALAGIFPQRALKSPAGKA
jgi:microcystin-dependent protein